MKAIDKPETSTFSQFYGMQRFAWENKRHVTLRRKTGEVTELLLIGADSNQHHVTENARPVSLNYLKDPEAIALFTEGRWALV